MFSSKGAPSLGLLAKSSSNQEDVQFDGEAMCKYPSALKCFKQTADVEVKPTFCSSKVPVKGILNVCAYDVGCRPLSQLFLLCALVMTDVSQ